ncbi:glycosyl hydrolase family 76-domain-containing protein [Limtongia smithiae]|uniref:glycosyl hydrolase family 76-domain-containing protein n=1 Tax=Limtongia smithiae TaxID=1125753 RepID=UPI0034CF4FE3
MLRRLKNELKNGLQERLQPEFPAAHGGYYGDSAGAMPQRPLFDTALPASFDAATEGVDLARRTQSFFYSPRHTQYCARVDSAETIDPQHGYVVWAVAIGVWAQADLYARTRMECDGAALDTAFRALERHWNPRRSAYCAWIYYDGNNDIYYDDNAHCVNALISAYQATGKREYMDRVIAVMTQLVPTGWDKSGNPGGVPWHVAKPNSRNACSTCALAVAAGRLALMNIQPQYFGDMLADFVKFTQAHLLDNNEHLIHDSIAYDGTKWKIERVKWTYNTGFAIESFVLLYHLRGSQEHLDIAQKMASAALDRKGALYDKKATDVSKRWWWDKTYFAQHLVDGLVALAKTLGPTNELSKRIEAELEHLDGYMRAYLFDPVDGLYFRSLRLYTIDDAHVQAYNALTGGTRTLEADKEERENGGGDVAHRRMAKTLLANAAVARIYLRTAEIVPTIHLNTQ